MISALAWVRRGAAARVPRTEGALDEGALESVIPGSGAWEDKPAAVAASSSSGKRRAGGDDDDDSDDDEFRLQRLTAGNLMHHKSNKDDPNMQMREEDDDDSELDDFEIGETDLVLLGARSDEQLSSLEAYIYEEPADNLYPHHDVPLPVFPLCVAWFDFQPGGGSGSGARGNFAAVGTFAPYIEVWDLDVMDALEPCVVIGAEAAARVADEEVTSHAAEALMASSKQKHGSHAVARAEGKQKGKKKKVLGGEGSGPQGHRDAVMCLAWNTMQPNALASGSADHTVRLWDLEGDCAGSVATLSHHRDKVQHMVWHPADATSLLTAGFDKRSVLVDVRTPDGAAREWGLTADAEKVAWHPSGTSFAVSTEDGLVQSFDTRAGATTAPLWKLQAHTQACAGLDFNHHVDGLLATGGQDKVVKLWTLDGSGGVPTLLAKRNLQLGAIFDISWCKDSPVRARAARRASSRAPSLSSPSRSHPLRACLVCGLCAGAASRGRLQG